MALLGVLRRAFMRPVVTFREGAICGRLFMGRYILKGDKKIERGSPPTASSALVVPRREAQWGPEQSRPSGGQSTVEAQWGPEA